MYVCYMYVQYFVTATGGGVVPGNLEVLKLNQCSVKNRRLAAARALPLKICSSPTCVKRVYSATELQ